LQRQVAIASISHCGIAGDEDSQRSGRSEGRINDNAAELIALAWNLDRERRGGQPVASATVGIYGAVGWGLALYFASEGANRVLFPVLAGTVRMVIAASVGWSAVIWYGAALPTLYQIVALASVAFGALTQPFSAAPGAGIRRNSRSARPAHRDSRRLFALPPM
jgi:hypothetical protein